MNFKYKFCSEAASYGNLEELKRMHLSGFPWDENTPARAAENGHLECLKYAHENGCPWNICTTLYASYKGRLDCLRYAHDNGCEWSYTIPAMACYNGQFECFKYCFEMWNDPQEFWKCDYDLTKIIDKIDLDEPLWRRLFNIDLKNHPKLESKVEDKKKKIEEIKDVSKDALQNTLPMDVIKYCIHTYF